MYVLSIRRIPLEHGKTLSDNRIWPADVHFFSVSANTACTVP